MDEQIFMFKSDGKLAQHGVYDLDTQQANQLVNEGKATKVSLGDYNEYRQKAVQAHNDYKKAQKRIQESDNPLHTDEYKEYELKKAYEQFEAETSQLQSEWASKRDEMQGEARAKAARATIGVSTSDKQTAEQVANRLSLNIAGADNAAQLSEIVEQASNDISYLSDAEKTALQGQIGGLLSQVETKADKYGAKVKASTLVSAAQDVRNMDLLSAKVADQLPPSVDIEYRQIKTIKDRKVSSRNQTLR